MRLVPRPEVCSKYYIHSNKIDVHNQCRQFELRLEKHWVTHCGFFRIVTTLFGITVCDAWLGYKHHLPDVHPHKNMSILQFASVLARDCLENEYGNTRPSSMMLTIGVPTVGSFSSVTDEFGTPAKKSKTDHSPKSAASVGTKTTSSISTSTSVREAFKRHEELEQAPMDIPFECDGRKGRRRSRGRCRSCGMKTSWYCPACEPRPGSQREWYCTKERCTLQHKRDVEADACKNVPGCSGWLKQTSSSVWMN